MSRIGKQPIEIPDQVTIKIDAKLIVIKGPKGELKLEIPGKVIVEQEDNTLSVKVKDTSDRRQNALWGTYQRLISNLIEGVTAGYEKKLEINGVGYKTQLKGLELILEVGFSHPVVFKIPKGIEIKIEKNIIIVSGIDKQLVGETAAQIRKIKPPEPYKGKGIKYIDEFIKRKVGKQVKTAEAAAA